MHIKELIHKTTAFTLAEMMVILTIMSVVMAATLPVITAPDSAVLSGDASDSEEYWTYSETAQTFSTPNFVAIGMAPDATTPGINTASLFLNNNSDDKNTSHILFTETDKDETYKTYKTYLGGRLFMGPQNAYNVALGAHAMPNIERSDVHNIAIGVKAMYANGPRKLSVAIGREALYSNTSDRDVAIGIGALSALKDSSSEHTVGLGYFAGAMNSGTMKRGTHIGYMAGYTDDENHAEEDNTNIGYQAGMLSEGNRVVNIGSLAGANYKNSYNNNKADSASEVVNIGLWAGAMPKDWNDGKYVDNPINMRGHVAIGNKALYFPEGDVSDVVALGSYAAYRAKGNNKGSVFIGYEAGADSLSSYAYPNTVAIGYYANYRSPSTAVAIGFNAGGEENLSTSSATTTSKKLNEVAIGYMAGVSTYLNELSYGNIFIGSNLMARSARGALANCICIGYNACTGAENLQYSLIMETNSGGLSFAPKTSGAGKLASFSLIAKDRLYHQEIPDCMHYSDNEADKWGQMLIVGDTVLDATTVFAPEAQPKTNSDKRLKKNIKPYKYSLKELRGVNVYEYNYIKDLGTRRIGVMAQELLKIMPEAVDKSDKNQYTISPNWMFYAVVNAVKELDKSIENCRTTIVAYAKEYQVLSTKVKMLENEQKQIEKERKSLERQINRAYRKAEKMEKSV